MSQPSSKPASLQTIMQSLQEQCRRVVEEQRRIEFRDDDWTDSCVIISKAELSSLEKALDLLASRTRSGHDLNRLVRTLCCDGMDDLAPPALPLPSMR